MRRAIVLLTVALLALPAAPAQAGNHNAKPRVRITRIEPVGPGPDGTTEYAIRVEALDRDGIISELALDFGDGAMVWLLLACTEPGERAVQDLTWTYAPGRYTLRAWGYSTTGCFEGEFQESRIDRARVKVS